LTIGLVSRNKIWIYSEGSLQGTLISHHLGDSNQSGSVAAVYFQGFLVRTLGIARIVFLKKQVPPQNMSLKIVRASADSLVEQTVGIVKVVH
jgi:hypothetical protein